MKFNPTTAIPYWSHSLVLYCNIHCNLHLLHAVCVCVCVCASVCASACRSVLFLFLSIAVFYSVSCQTMSMTCLPCVDRQRPIRRRLRLVEWCMAKSHRYFGLLLFCNGADLSVDRMNGFNGEKKTKTTREQKMFLLKCAHVNKPSNQSPITHLKPNQSDCLQRCRYAQRSLGTSILLEIDSGCSC